MKLCVSSYSYSRLLGSGKMSMLDVPAKAKEMGFDGLEFSEFASPDGRPLEEYAAELRAAAEKAGIPLVNYAVGADLLTGGDEGIEAGMALLKRKVDVAAILGVPSMRHDVWYGGFPADWRGARTFTAVMPILADRIREVTEYAASKGIRTMSENHGFIFQDAERVEKLVAMVNSPNYGVLVDIGNFLCADEDPTRATGILKTLAFHCHVKDFHVKSGALPAPGSGWFNSRSGNWLRGAIIGHGEVPVVQCLRTLFQAGYKGNVSIEFEGMEDPLVGIAIGLENLKRFVAMAQA